MAPRLFSLLGLFILLNVLTASTRASLTKDEASSDAAADKFLRACCANTTSAIVCYNSLHHRVRSFEGNLVKVTSAATSIAYARLRSFTAELRGVLRRGSGAGESVDKVLEFCIEDSKSVLLDEDDTLAKLRRLESAEFRRGELADSYLNLVNLHVGDVLSAIGLICMDDFISSRNGILGSPIGKKMQSGDAIINLYGGIALDLVDSIKL